MFSSKHSAYVSLIFMVVLVNEATAQPHLLSAFCENSDIFTTNSTYLANLNRLLSTIPSNMDATNSGFYNSSYGQNADKVYATGLCRGDVKPEACRSCLNYSANAITKSCPNRKEAYQWYDECMLRYSNESIFATVDIYPRYLSWSEYNVSSNEVAGFKQVLMTLLGDLKKKAAAGGSLRKFATGNETAPSFETIHALMQCTPDLSLTNCTNCLDIAMGDIPQCCDGKKGGRVIRQSCTLRYEVYLFYEPDSPSVGTPPPSPTTQDKKSNTSRTIILIIAPIVTGLVLIVCICAYLRSVRKRKKNVETFSTHEAADEIASAESLQYDFKTIQLATDNFSAANKLGQGGFGPVYRLQHRNLVRLFGFCFDGNERLLVYEFVPNASLDHFIFDRMKRANMDWNKRYKIIGGIARGLFYLHEDSWLRIIHRDLKASNILLDEEMNSKISDFGMARLFMVDQTQADTSRIVGTHGYMAPEYAMNGHFSVKSDVYSFGVLLLEIVSGQKNNCFHHRENVEDLLTFAWKNWREGTGSNVVDSMMRGGSTSEMMRCIHIALLCVQENANDRPTMNSIVLMLNSNSVTLPVPSRPAFFMHSSIDESSGGTSLESYHNSGVPSSDDQRSRAKSSNFVHASTNEASITDLYPR